MSEHLTQKQIQEYRNRRLSPDELAAVDAHLEECDACARQLMTPAQRRIAMQTIETFLAPPVHLPYEQQEKYVDGALSEAERRRIEAHLRDCSLCRNDVEDLSAFRFSLLNDAASQIAAPAAQRKSGFTWRPVLRTGLFSLASAAAAALLVWLAVPHHASAPLIATNPAATESIKQQLAQERTAHQADNARLQSEAEQARAKSKTAQFVAQRSNAELARKNVAIQQMSAELKNRNNALKQALDSKNRQIVAALNKAEMKKEQSAIQIPVHSDEQQNRTTAMEGGNIHLPRFRELASENWHTVRGAAFQPTEPIGTVVLSDQPTLVWEPLAEAQGYNVTVFSLDNTKQAGNEEPIHGTSWKVSSPLPRGKTYYWQVAAIDGSGQTVLPQNNPKPRFKVLEKKGLPRFLQAELETAVLLAQNGLYDEAEARLEAIVSADAAAPESKKAAKLLKTIRDQRKK